MKKCQKPMLKTSGFQGKAPLFKYMHMLKYLTLAIRELENILLSVQAHAND